MAQTQPSSPRHAISLPASHATSFPEHQQAYPDEKEDAAVDGPFRLAGHEAAWQDVDPLKDPDASCNETQDGDDVEHDAHWGSMLLNPPRRHSIDRAVPDTPAVLHIR